jgi:phospholipid/cholesterol/gamma-HCH transport system substrate-binding protein
MKRHRAELRAGLFINLAIALIILALTFFGQSLNPFSKPTRYHLIVPDAQGLLSGAKVLVAGVTAGKVINLTVDPKTSQVVVNFELAPQYQNTVHQDSHAYLSTQGVLGDKVVKLNPGRSDQPLLPVGGEIRVRPSASINQLVDEGDVFIKHLDGLVGSLDRILSERTARETSEAIHHLSRAAQSLDKGLDPVLLNKALTNLDEILSKINHGQGTLGALINDPSVYDQLKAITGSANQSKIVRNFTRSMINEEEAKEHPPG